MNKIFCKRGRIDFINKAAHVYLDAYRMNPEIEKLQLDGLYKHQKSETKYIDLCSGFNFIHFFNGLDKDTTYYLVDKSISTCECINISIKNKELSNVVVINKGINDIMLDDIGDNISVIRANNIWRYINNFQEYIPKFKSFIMKGGVFLFQKYSCVNIYSLQNNPYTWLDGYFGENWEKEFTLQKTENIRAFDTFIYRKMY